uniref:Amyloid beta (A4) precursor protein-binding, family B, member 3 n=1 Tax=Gadus morhua TaxID=8049 RepID=A0A8C5BAN2_GADMO
MIGRSTPGGDALVGKDYMLAIIMVNCNENIWSDQSRSDPDLPSDWRMITDSSGTYYWHVASGATQWHHPCESSRKANGTNQVSYIKKYAHHPSCNILQIIHHRLVFSVRSMGWVEVPEEGLFPGRSSLTVNNIIQQLSHHRSSEQTHCQGPWGEGQDMLLVLKKDTLSLMDPLDHTLLHSQPISNIRVWGVGCSNGRDFAFVTGEKDSCVLKGHVFRCNAPARAIATVLQDMCGKVDDAPVYIYADGVMSFLVDLLDAVRQHAPHFDVQYIGNLPVSRAMGMEVLNSAIESIMNTTEREAWEPVTLHVSDSLLSLRRVQEAESLWECQVSHLTFLGVGHDSHTFAVIADGGAPGFQCHVFWCEPHAGHVSEALQAACMLQYQRCLVAQTPPVRSKHRHAGTGRVQRANSMDSSAFLPSPSYYHGGNGGKGGSSNCSNTSAKKGMLAFFETFRNKQATTHW